MPSMGYHVAEKNSRSANRTIKDDLPPQKLAIHGQSANMSRTTDNETPVVNIETPKLSGRYADESYKLFSKVDIQEASPEEAKRLRNKCIKWILPFLCIGYHLMYVDKQTVSMNGGLSAGILLTLLSARQLIDTGNPGRR